MSAAWVPHDQLCAIIETTALSLIATCYQFSTQKSPGALWREFGNVSPAERLVMFELVTFRFDYKA